MQQYSFVRRHQGAGIYGFVHSPFLMKVTSIIGMMLLLWSSLVAQHQTAYDGVRAIHEIREGWVIVRLPGFAKKLAVLDSLLAKNDLSDKNRIRLQTEKNRTLREQNFIHAFYPAAFDSLYHFSKYAFIDMSQTERFQKGAVAAWRADGEQFPSAYKENYFFATLQGAVGKPFHFTTKDHRDLAFPFPDNIAKPGGFAVPLFTRPLPSWTESYSVDKSTRRRAYKHVYRLNQVLYKFYQRKQAEIYRLYKQD